jgi:hypothetical protein
VVGCRLCVAVTHAVVVLCGRYEIHREMSTTAALKFADGSLDFVYLDALHSYRDCMNDILAWFPKVRWTVLVLLVATVAEAHTAARV